MKIDLLLFAHHRHLAGKERWKLDLEEGAVSGDVLAALEKACPKVKGLLGHFAVTVNKEYVDENHPLRDGDEVAFLPPMDGG